MDDLHNQAERLRILLHDKLAPEPHPHSNEVIQQALNLRESIEMGRDQQHLKDQAKRLESMLHEGQHHGYISPDFQGQANQMIHEIRHRIDHM
jgi:hypothetical protein